jgi:hypothetical protein
MAALFSLTVDHRPFVQAEAAMEGCARRDRPAELPAEGETAGLRRVRQSDSDESVRSTQEAAVIDEFIGISQRDTGSRRPPPDGREAERIISEEKIFDGIALALLGALATRAAFHGCFGLHEWAMVYGQAEQRRHGAWPLRLGAEGTDAVVRAMPVRCTHYDAFRFFTPGARPLNKLAPTLEARVDNEQPGCVHVTMDLFKWAMKAQPWVSAELAADAFELAHVARTVDMRASPYDFSAIGLKPIAIETAEGRSEYETEQRRLSALAEPVRARLIAELERALA